MINFKCLRYRDSDLIPSCDLYDLAKAQCIGGDLTTCPYFNDSDVIDSVYIALSVLMNKRDSINSEIEGLRVKYKLKD